MTRTNQLTKRSHTVSVLRISNFSTSVQRISMIASIRLLLLVPRLDNSCWFSILSTIIAYLISDVATDTIDGAVGKNWFTIFLLHTSVDPLGGLANNHTVLSLMLSVVWCCSRRNVYAVFFFSVPSIGMICCFSTLNYIRRWCNIRDMAATGVSLWIAGEVYLIHLIAVG